jgi:hypothetical protein
MLDLPTLAPGSTRLAAPDRHPPIRSVSLTLSRIGARRPASTIRVLPGTTAGGSSI